MCRKLIVMQRNRTTMQALHTIAMCVLKGFLSSLTGIRRRHLRTLLYLRRAAAQPHMASPTPAFDFGLPCDRIQRQCNIA
jgi:hypothetical protein